ncbi:MAG: hypothetical protein RLN62_02860 [Rickettsiales bacterium]
MVSTLEELNIKSEEFLDNDSGKVTSIYEVGTIKLCFTTHK